MATRTLIPGKLYRISSVLIELWRLPIGVLNPKRILAKRGTLVQYIREAMAEDFPDHNTGRIGKPYVDDRFVAVLSGELLVFVNRVYLEDIFSENLDVDEV